jgi:hypothetical protein
MGGRKELYSKNFNSLRRLSFKALKMNLRPVVVITFPPRLWHVKRGDSKGMNPTPEKTSSD